MSTIITSQPRAQDSQENQEEMTSTPLTGEDEETEEEKRKKNTAVDPEDVCCCILESAEDTWCICQCIAWCFRSLGNCMDECCSGCAEGIANCCESSNETAVSTDDGCFCCDCDCSD